MVVVSEQFARIVPQLVFEKRETGQAWSASLPPNPTDAVQRLNCFGVRYCSGISLIMFCMMPGPVSEESPP